MQTVDKQPQPRILRREFNDVSRLSTEGGLLSPTARFDAETIETIVERFLNEVDGWADEHGYEVWIDLERDSEDRITEVFFETDASVVTGHIRIVDKPPHPHEIRVSIDYVMRGDEAAYEVLEKRIHSVSLDGLADEDES